MDMHSHGPKCKCCEEGMDEVRKWEQEQIQKNGWYAHYVTDDRGEQPEIWCNYHTHGIEETWGHPDFQVVIAIPPKTCHNVFWGLVNAIKEGKRFEEGERADKILGNGYQITFKKVKEGNREVLRVILPDQDNHLTAEDATGFYLLQYEDD